MKATPRNRSRIFVNSRRWTSYAVAAAATVSTSASEAAADVIYSGVINEPVNQARLLLASGTTLVRGGTFRFFTDHTWHIVSVLNAHPLDATFAAYRTFFRTYLSNLGPNVDLSTIVPSLPYLSGGIVDRQFGSGYAGLRFDVGGGPQYAWLRIDSGYVVDWAYGTPGQSLRTAQQSVPESGSLGLLAAGASGLLAWRAARRDGR